MDLNGDGYKDLVFGSQSPQQLLFYKGDSEGELTKVGSIKDARGSNITSDVIIEGVVVDWNNDDLLDIVVGQRGGYNYPETIRLFINSGTKENYKFQHSSNILLRGEERLIGYQHFDVIDIDHDNKKDFIICGRRNHIGDPEWCGSVFPNVNTDTDPKFNNDKMLTTEGEIILGDWGPFVDVADWNDDGAYDLIMGKTEENKGGIQIYLGKPQTKIIEKSPLKQLNNAIEIRAGSSSINIHFSFDSFRSVQLQVVSMNGKVLKHIDCGPVYPGNHQFEVGYSELPSSVYVINCLINGKRTIQQKVICLK